MTPIPTFRPGRIVYPDADGKRMAENTLQYEWIVAIHTGLELLFRSREDVFVAADNLIYPVQGNPRIATAPDVYVAFGRPKGHRGSYKVWEEDGIFPQVVFEVWSPGNTLTEMIDKRGFFRQYGAEEFHLIDPQNGHAEVWVREGAQFVEVQDLSAFVSPRLGLRYEPAGDAISLIGPDGRRFESALEMGEARERLSQQVDEEKKRVEEEKQRAIEAVERAAKMAAKLRELGIDPDAV
jgi:Uma2 family endonuclease